MPIAKLSSAHILTTQYVQGVPIPEFLKENPDATTKSLIGKDLLLFALKSPLLYGKFNADPNPGNFLISRQNGSVSIGLIDFGLTIQLEQYIVDADRLLFFSLLKSDAEMFRLALNKSELVEQAAVFQSSQYRKFERLFAELFSNNDFVCTTIYANEITRLFWSLVESRQFILSPKNIFLWRHRIAMLNLLGMLECKPHGATSLKEIFKDLGRE